MAGNMFFRPWVKEGDKIKQVAGKEAESVRQEAEKMKVGRCRSTL